MELSFLGGAREVGKSSVLLNVDGLDLMFDSGIKLDEPPTYPLGADNVDACFLSHSHLDHCGYLPALHRRHKMPIYASAVAFELSHMLQKDSIKIDKIKGIPPKYNENDMARMSQGEIHASYGKRYDFHSKIGFSFYDAGHIPGSAGIHVETSEGSVFYTGDTHSADTRLLKAAKYPKHADIVITESTYGYRQHPKRRDVENDFLKNIEDTLERGGVALVPSFAIGRTQEILLVLESLEYPVYLDGMGKRACQTMLRFPDTLKSHSKLLQAVDNTIWVKSRRQRKKICQQPAIIVTTAGMLEGGPVIDYLSQLHNDPNSSILLTGYQVEDTNGRLLVDEGHIIDQEMGQRFKVDMQISQYDFSAHSGRDEIIRTVKDMNPDHVVLVHGDDEAIDSLSSEFGSIKVHTPSVGDRIRI